MELVLDSPRLPARRRFATMQRMSANETSDGELIRRAGDGDRGAFEVLYRRYSRPVFGSGAARARRRGRSRGCSAGDFRLGLARGAYLQAGARPGRPVAL